MKALSFSRPWDYLILHPPFKNVENRKWATNYRGRIYVHRAKSWDEEGFRWILEHRFELGISGTTIDILRDHRAQQDIKGKIMGEVDITGVMQRGDTRYPQYFSPWFFGPFGFILANPIVYDKPIPYRGMPGLFEVNLENREGGKG
jgi:hypothetical protein